jgi:hypothetical protein
VSITLPPILLLTVSISPPADPKGVILSKATKLPPPVSLVPVTSKIFPVY